MKDKQNDESMIEEKKTEKTQTQIANTEPTGDLINLEKNEKTLVAQNTQPPGKCPIHLRYKDGKIEGIDLKEPYNSEGRQVLQDLTATQDENISTEIVLRAISAMPQPHRLEHNFNTIFQSLADNAPKDSIEAKLSLQSTVLYAQGMRYIEKAENCDRIDHSEFYMKNAIKLLRLHNETIEAVNKHRRGSEQRIIVQHVQVNDGGQAVVGGVVNGGRGEKTSR